MEDAYSLVIRKNYITYPSELQRLSSVENYLPFWDAVAIFSSMAHPPRAHYYTVAEYLAMEEAAEFRSEYFEGEIFAMAGSSLEHEQIVGELNRLLGNALLGHPCQSLGSNIKIRIQDSSAYYYADLSIVCEKPILEDHKRHLLTNPVVIIEVLSPSTESFDRRKKFNRYMQISSFREYVLIAQDEPQIDVYFKEDDGIWYPRRYAGLDDVMELRSLGIQLKLADIYRLVEFEA